MKTFLLTLLGLSGSLLTSYAQGQTAPTPEAPATATAPVLTPTLPPLSEDSVKAMAGLVQQSVRQLRGIYFEPNNARTVQLIDAALVDIPQLNQRLSRYTASLPREQQQLLAQRLRQHSWQVELQTLLRSPQYKAFDSRAAKDSSLLAAATRLREAGFMGTGKTAGTPATPAAAPAATTAEVAKPAAAPATAATTPAPKPAETAAATAKPAATAPAKPAAATTGASKPAAPAATAATITPKPAVATKAVPAKAAAPATPGVAATKSAPAPKPAPAAKAAVPSAGKPTPAAPAATSPRQHTVAKGETLFGICRKYQLTPAQVKAWNNKTDDVVRVGEVLQLNAPK